MIHQAKLAVALTVLAMATAACGGTSSSTDPSEGPAAPVGGDPLAGAEPELVSSASLATGSFATVETPGDQLDPFGCRHYQLLTVGGGKSPRATLTSKLDSADKSEIDPDGSCGGEELPKNEHSDYPLKFASKTSCGAAVYTGTIKWTTDGKVTRTMRLTDYRVGTCTSKPARVVAELTSSYKGDTNKIATYYSVDPVR